MFVDNIPHKEVNAGYEQPFKMANVIGAVVDLRVGTKQLFYDKHIYKKSIFNYHVAAG